METRTESPSRAQLSTERTALKEWAVLVDAMVRGDFVAMIRKGGIREQRAGFAIRHDRFLLYPTYFHENVDELSPPLRELLPASHGHRAEGGTVRIGNLAAVRAVWRVSDIEKLHLIEGQHGLSRKAVESRFNYRNRPGVHVVALELSRLPVPVTIPEARRYLGCVSWVELDEAVDISAAERIHPSEFVNERVALLTEALGVPDQGS